jgi:hypothetical protein
MAVARVHGQEAGLHAGLSSRSAAMKARSASRRFSASAGASPLATALR